MKMISALMVFLMATTAQSAGYLYSCEVSAKIVKIEKSQRLGGVVIHNSGFQTYDEIATIEILKTGAPRGIEACPHQKGQVVQLVVGDDYFETLEKDQKLVIFYTAFGDEKTQTHGWNILNQD